MYKYICIYIYIYVYNRHIYIYIYIYIHIHTYMCGRLMAHAVDREVRVHGEEAGGDKRLVTTQSFALTP